MYSLLIESSSSIVTRTTLGVPEGIRSAEDEKVLMNRYMTTRAAQKIIAPNWICFHLTLEVFDSRVYGGGLDVFRTG